MTFTAAERQTLAKARKIKRKASKAAKRARPVSPKADRGRVRDAAYLAWLRRQPCALSRWLAAYCSGHIDAAHIRTPRPGEPPTGLQRKPDDRRATPLCRSHHTHQHSMNELAFWRMFSLDPFRVAEEHYQRFLSESSCKNTDAAGKTGDGA